MIEHDWIRVRSKHTQIHGRSCSNCGIDELSFNKDFSNSVFHNYDIMTIFDDPGCKPSIKQLARKVVERLGA